MIEFVDIDHAQELDAFVLQHKYCHFMQVSAWGRVKTDWGWHGIISRDGAGRIRGTMAILRHDVHYIRTCFIYAPRGPIFDDGDRETFEELVEGAKQLAKKLGAYMIRLDPRLEYSNTAFSDMAKSLGFTQAAASDYSQFQPRMCYVSDLQGLTAETLLSHYHRSTRYNVRLAERRGITWRLGTVEDLPEFCRMMEITAKKDDFTPRPASYFRSFMENLGDMARMYIAQKDGKPVAATITAELGDRVWHMYGCSDTAYLNDRPNELLQYQMQLHVIESGKRYFDFRGVEGYPVEDNPKVGLHHYKQGFGAEFHEYVGQFDLITKPMMCRLTNFLFGLKNR